jgi:hypothetical protein
VAQPGDPLDPDSSPAAFHFDHVGSLRGDAENGDVDAMQQLGSLLISEGRTMEGAEWLNRATIGGNVDAYPALERALTDLGRESVFGDPEKMKAVEDMLRTLNPGLDGAAIDQLKQELSGGSGGPSAETPEEEDEDEAFSLAARAVSDLPEVDDALGFAPLVEGLRALLNVRRTSLPLAIAIAAPWGAGKSSVMLQLRELLRAPGDRQPRERKWWTVDFPAWKYERSERLWAALAKSIYEQPQKQMGLWRRVWFRIRVEWERLGWRKFLLKGIWPPIAAAAAVIAALAVGSDLDGSKAVLGVSLSSFAAFSAGVTHYWGLASMPFKRAIEKYSSAPDYDHQLGFTAEADRDIRSLARVLAPDTESDPQALAVFVDDLDRCTSTHVVEVVEAMNQIFNSDGRHGCVFVLGLDREVVATSIEVAYGPTVDRLQKAKRPVGYGFGMSFLAKLVQLVVTVPEPTEAGIERLLARITQNRIPAQDDTVDTGDIAIAEEHIKEEQPSSLAAISASEPQANISAEAVEEGRRRARAESIEDSPDVVKAEFEVLEYLGRNPRLIKRFDNAFRLQLYVANEDRDCRLDFSLGELVALGKWVGLRLRWPHLAEVLDDEPELISLLEAKANGEPRPNAMDEAEEMRLSAAYTTWFENREVAGFLRDRDDGTHSRIATLRPGSFLQVS